MIADIIISPLGQLTWEQVPVWAQLLISFVLFSGVAASALVVGISQVRKQRADELEDLADGRGKKIEDLESELATLRADLKKVEGQLEAYQSIKAQEIALEVARMLAPMLQGALHPGLVEGA